jgi:DNA helicase-2/ATP-dependent DNA helicase PcrA
MSRFKKIVRVKKPPVVGTDEQEAIWKAILSTTKHVVVKAGAGTGKTFTAIHSIKKRMKLPSAGRVVIVCFNKSIQMELQTKVPPGVVACTMHSLGLSLISNALGRPEILFSKSMGILRSDLGLGDDEKLPWALANAVERIVSICKGQGSKAAKDFSDEDLDTIAATFDITMPPDRSSCFDYVRSVLAQSDANPHVVDFDDMLRIPLVHNLVDDVKYDLMVVDEAQDLNPTQQQMALRLAKRLMFVGDERQAIYGFRGADVRSMQNVIDSLQKTEPSLSVLPLTKTRRCPKLHVLLANQIVPDFHALPEAAEGKVFTVADNFLADTLTGSPLVVCRVNAPLVKTAYELIKRDVRCRIQGRDFGSGLVILLRKIVNFKPFPSVSREVLFNLIELHRSNEEAKLLASTSKAAATKLATLQDKCECLNYLAENEETAQGVVNRIERLFSDDKGKAGDCVLLSTVHRAKGLEANRVVILSPEKMPHPMAKLDWEKEQELNICYVAITRSLNELCFVGQLPPCLSIPDGYTWAFVSSGVSELVPVTSTKGKDNDKEKGRPQEEESPRERSVGSNAGPTKANQAGSLQKRLRSEAGRIHPMQAMPREVERLHANQGTRVSRRSTKVDKEIRSQKVGLEKGEAIVDQKGFLQAVKALQAEGRLIVGHVGDNTTTTKKGLKKPNGKKSGRKKGRGK